jgi:hypothetical protein
MGGLREINFLAGQGEHQTKSFSVKNIFTQTNTECVWLEGQPQKMIGCLTVPTSFLQVIGGSMVLHGMPFE